MSIVLQSSGGGQITLQEPTTASNFTQTLPIGTGTTVVNGVNSAIVSGSAVASTSGTSIDFTSIPSWVKRITVMFNAVSLSGTSNFLIQIGAGSVETSGYQSTSAAQSGSSNLTPLQSTAGFILCGLSEPNQVIGSMVIATIGGNSWISDHLTRNGQSFLTKGAGNKTLSGALDRVRITTVNGTDTFDAGSINILYE